MEVVKNILSDKYIKSIPKGKEKEAVKYRYNLICNELEKHVKTAVHNRCIKNNIKVTAKSVKEIAFHASKGYVSTVKALNAINAIAKSSVLYIDKPKDGKQLKYFYACIIIVLHCELSGIGEVKVTIVDRFNPNNKNNDFYLYCIT